MPPDMRRKNPRRFINPPAANTGSPLPAIPHLSVHVEEARRVHERVTEGCQCLSVSFFLVRRPGGGGWLAPLVRKLVQGGEGDTFLVVAGGAGQGDQKGPLDLLGGIGPGLGTHAPGELFRQLLDRKS